LERGRGIASDKINGFVTKTAKLLGCKDDDLGSAVKFLEKKFPIPSDGNTPDFGGGLQHHLRDFAHHPTIVGLAFSLLTQFTGKAYGTDVAGVFKVVDVPAISKAFIGKDVPQKILFGTIQWFFHLVSDMAGSSSSAGLSGGTGIPGPLLALAKELSALPIFKSPRFLSKLFNGTLFLKRDSAGQVIKESVLRFDLRAELGVGVELGRQAIPVVANECIVRSFYFLRRLAMEIKNGNIHSFADLKQIDLDKVKPYQNPTVDRMLTVATGVFTTVDVGAAAASQQWLCVNFVGVARFAVAIGTDVSWGLKARKVKQIKDMYEVIKRNTFAEEDNNIYERIGEGLDSNKFGLTVKQTEILYNLEYFKTRADIAEATKTFKDGELVDLRHAWLKEWKEMITRGFPTFLQIPDAQMHWYSEEELMAKISKNHPEETWFRLVLLEAMLFEPYYPLGTEKDKKGNQVPSKKYKAINGPLMGYSKNAGDEFLESFFRFKAYYQVGYIARLRKCYKAVMLEMKEVMKTLLIGTAITGGATILTIATAGILAFPIAVALGGSTLAGLHGAALTSAALALMGGGAIAAGGAGMAHGVAVIIGGGALLGVGVGAGIGGTVGAASLVSKRETILQSAKLLVAVREIFLNDEHDLAYSNTVYEQYVQTIMELEKKLTVLKIRADEASGEKQKALKAEIKELADSIHAMQIARKSLLKFKSSFQK
jgi:hypothetical protein